MRFHRMLLIAAMAVVFLSACSNAQLQTGILAAPAHSAKSRPNEIRPETVYWQDSLFVGNYFTNPPSVELFADGTWVPNGSVTAGVTAPDGIWSDQKYLYVANDAVGNNGADVEEYRPNRTAPIFTYANGLSGNISSVSTQMLGNVHYVFITGGSSGSAGFVKELKRDTNTVIATCYPAAAPSTATGVAVDANGNVFVGYNPGGSGRIIEYVGGLSGCNGSVLPMLFGVVGDMVLDSAGRLVVCDPSVGVIDLVDPPYTSIAGTLGSGWFSPTFVSIRANNQRAYVADNGAGFHVVKVLQYPSGTLLHTFTSADGLAGPSGVVDWHNYGF